MVNTSGVVIAITILCQACRSCAAFFLSSTGRDGSFKLLSTCNRYASCKVFQTKTNEDVSMISSDNSIKTGISDKSSTGLPPIQQIKGVIFDMDGTLIEHCIDFAEMRKRVYEIADADPVLQIEPEEKRRGDVLELYHHFSAEGQVLVKAVFDDIEENALRNMKLMESVGDLCHFLDGKGIKRAVLTRNVGKSVDVMHQKLWNEHSAKEFFPAVNRETVGDEQKGPLPSKPSPEAIYHICNSWGCNSDEVVMVGDSDADDIAAAFRAGCIGRVLLKHNGISFDNDAGGGGATSASQYEEREPSLVVSNLGELLNIMREE